MLTLSRMSFQLAFLLSWLIQDFACGQPSSKSFSLYSIEVQNAPSRSWTNCFDETSEAKCLGVTAGLVSLEVAGKVQQVPLVTLSDEDVAYVKGAVMQSGKQEMWLGNVTPDEEAAKLELPVKDWKSQIHTLSRDVQAGSKLPAQASQALRKVRSLQDRNALQSLDSSLEQGRTSDVNIAILETLASWKEDAATSIVVREAVTNKRKEVSMAAAWLLKNMESSPKIMVDFSQLLKTSNFQSALSTLHATGLLRPLGPGEKPNPELTAGMISRLTMKQQERIPWYIWSGSDTGWIPSTTGGRPSRHAHFSARRTTKVIETEVPNPLAYEMLKQYSGKDYGYNRNEWRSWMKTGPEAEYVRPKN